MRIRALVERAIFLTIFLTFFLAVAFAPPVLAQISPPEANAGIDRTVAVGDVVVLDATRSVGTGQIPGSGAMFTLSWTLVSAPAGSAAALTGPTQMKPTFQVDQPGDYVIQLVVTEGAVVSALDTVVISTDNSAPVADPGLDRKILAGQIVQLDGGGSWDVDGDRLSYAWTLVSAPAGSGVAISDASEIQPIFTATLEGTYIAELVVSDGVRSSDAKRVTFATGNMAPVADAGSDEIGVTFPATILDGYRSSDPDGDGLAYNWSVLWGPDTASLSLSDETQRRATFALSAGGIYVLQLVTSDGVAVSRPDTMVVRGSGAGNLPPVANAGPDQAVIAGSTVRLDTTNSVEIDGNSLKFRWALVSAPEGSLATISNPAAPRPSFTADLPGAYVAQLIASDGIEDSMPDTIVISTGNLPPVADAGPDQLDTSRVPLIQLNGAGSSDANGDALTYRWALTERPDRSVAALSDPAAVSPTFTADKAGVYMAQLYVGDGVSESAADTVIVSTEGRLTAYNNGRPTANAGADQAGVLLGASVQLSGSGSNDLEGGSQTYRWALTVKPEGSAATIAGATTVNPSFVADVGGLYVAQLIVKDVLLYSDPLDTVVIQTLNRGPTANAGPDQSVPTNATVALDGGGSTDPDGDPLSYSWTLSAKPSGSAAIIIGATTANPTFVADLDGVYTAGLTVSDGEYASPDSVTVTATNQPPMLGAIGPQTVDLGSTLRLTLTATDANPGATLAFTAQPLPLPAGAGLNGANGAFTFKPDETQVGTIALTFSVTDGLLTDSESVLITVNGAPVGGATAISGRILDTNDFAATGTITPVQGATVSVLNAPTVTAVSDTNGYFTLSGIPSGAQVLDIDSTTALAGPGGAIYAGFREELTLIADVTNTIDRPLYLPRIEAESLTTVNPAVDTVVTNARLGVSMTVWAGTARNPDGSLFTGQISISEVPAALAPASLPDLLKPGLLVTIQPVGVTFSSPAPITFPNIDGLAAGKRVDLWSLDAASGAFAVTGSLRVSTDTTQLTTVSGGIRAADWHFPGPRPANDTSEDDPKKNCPRSSSAPSGSSTSLCTGNLQISHELASYRSAGQDRSIQLVYNSTSADPRPIIKTDITFLANVFNVVPETVSTRLFMGGVERGTETFTDTRTLSQIVDESLTIGVQFDASDLESGVYTFEKTIMSNLAATAVGTRRVGQIRVNNERNSPVGAGWTIAGLSRLPVSGGVVLQTDGAGSISQYEVVSGSFEPAAAYGTIDVIAGRHEVVDFNGDGFLDVAWADVGFSDFEDTFVQILLGDGAGGFHTQLTTNAWPGQVPLDGWIAIPSAVHSGDFNKDGRQDLVTVHQNGGVVAIDRVSVQLGNGDGTFQASLQIEVGFGADAAVADFNGDDNLDIASIDYNNTTRIFFGDGTGAFPVVGPTSVSSGASRTLTVTDLNNDGFPDLVTEGSAAIVVRLNDGTGGFTVPVSYPSGDIRQGSFVEHLTVAHFNDDEFLDIAASNPLNSAISILLNDGAGGLQPRLIYAMPDPGRVFNLAAADFNRDGFQDIAAGRGFLTSLEERITILSGTGTGSFVKGQDITIFGRTAERALRTTDLDRDGWVDIITTTIIDQFGGRGGPPHVNVILGVPTGEIVYTSPDSDYSKLVLHTDGTYTRTLKDGTKIEFNAEGYQTAVVERTGRTTTYGYDLSNRLSTITDPVGKVTTFNYVGDRLDNIVDPASRVTKFRHDAAGNLAEITDPDLSVRQFDYDPEHRLITQTSKRGFVTRYEYDFAGRNVRSVWPDGSDRVMAAAQTAGLIDISDGTGTAGLPAPVVRVSEALGTFTDGNGNIEARKLNRFGATVQTTDALGRTRGTVRDENNNPTRFTEPDGTVTTVTYDASGNPRTVTQAVGLPEQRTIAMEFEPVFNLVSKVTVPGGQFMTMAYDAQGKLSEIKDLQGIRTAFAYGDLTCPDQPTTTTYAVGTVDAFVETRGYDSVTCDLVQLIDPFNKFTIFSYDTAGNLVRVTDALNGVTRYAYDAVGRVTLVAMPTNTALVPVCGTLGVTCFGYDGAGNLSSVTDARGHVTRYEYDNKDRVVKRVDPLNAFETYAYDLNGNLRFVTDRNSDVTELRYDAGNRLVTKLLQPGTVEEVLRSFDYDNRDNPITVSDPDSVLTMTYDAQSRLKTVDTTGSPYQPAVVLSYEYDANDNRLTMTGPQGVTGYGYDTLNKLTSLTTPSLPADPVIFGWDSLNRLGRIDLPNGVATDLTFDPLVRPTGVTHTLGAAVLSAFGYSNDAVGKVTQMTQTRSAVSVASTLTYGYDDEYQLTSASNPLGGADETFAYDASGNRLHRDGQVTDALFDAANHLIEDVGFCYVYDGNGNLTEKTAKVANACTGGRTTYSYDVELRMTRVDLPDGTIVEYRYDGFNRRIGKSINGIETRYVYDQEDILLEYDGTNAPRARYTHGPGVDQPLMMERDLDLDGLFAATERFFYHTDVLGSITELTDSTGAVVQAYVYDSFGRIALQTGTLVNPYTYTGREWDSKAGLYYYRARYYDATLGRFIQEDPIGFGGEDVNLYRYVGGNPISNVDPSGEIVWFAAPIIGAAIGGGIDFGIQMYKNGGNIKCIDWGNVGISAGLGAGFAALGPSGIVFGRAGKTAADLGYKGGIRNTGNFRIGWSWHKGRNWFGLHGGKPHTPGNWHQTPIPGPAGHGVLEFGIGGGAAGGAVGATLKDCDCKP